MSKRLILMLLAIVAVLGMATQVMAGEAENENPLEPLDASSPRAAYEAFIEQVGVIEERALDYRANRSLEAQNAFLDAVSKTGELSDLSDVAAASQAQVVEGNFAALADILMRIPLPDPETIPDADQVAADELTQWTVPGTEITFRPLEEGDRAGSWVLTPRTVEELPGWRQEVDGLPTTIEDVAITNWRQTIDLATGPLIPGEMIRSLPDVAQSRFLGSPLWKTVVAIIGAMLIVLVSYLWFRWIGRRGPKDSIRRHIFGLTTPVVLLVLLSLYQGFMAVQINYSGFLAELVVLGSTIAVWVAIAWLFRELIELVVEWVISTRFISNERYDTHLLRLISRVISAVGVVIILLIGANEIGIPALGLLATASVGGLVVGLAAQSTIENLIGGMTLFADKPFEVGDFVGFGEDNGTVEEIGPRSTRIRKLNGTQLTVPNSDIVQARISNYTQRDNALFLHMIGLRYETTLEQIEWLADQIRDGLRAHPKVEQDDDLPRVRLAAFGASSIDVEARAYVATRSVHEFMAVQGELLAMVMQRVEAAGTSMAFPSTTAYLRRDDGIEGPGALDAQPDDEPSPEPAGPEAQGPSPTWEEDDADTAEGAETAEGSDDR